MGILVSHLGLNLHFISDKLQFSDTNEMSNIRFNLILMLLTQLGAQPCNTAPTSDTSCKWGAQATHTFVWPTVTVGAPTNPSF